MSIRIATMITEKQALKLLKTKRVPAGWKLTERELSNVRKGLALRRKLWKEKRDFRL